MSRWRFQVTAATSCSPDTSALPPASPSSGCCASRCLSAALGERLLAALPPHAARGRVGARAAVRRGGRSRACPGRTWAGSATYPSVAPAPTREPRTTGRASSTPDGGSHTPARSTLDRLLALNIETYLLDDLLVKTDRMSMAHGLEVRSPFLDTELVEFAARLSAGAQGSRAVAQASPQAAVDGSASGRHPHRARSAGSVSPSTAGSARTSRPTRRRSSAEAHAFANI